MRTTSKRIVYSLALLAILAAPQSARAGAKEEARKHYDRAVELIDDGQLAEAIVEFQRSYDLTKHFSVLYNIGQVYVSLAKPVEAIAAYEGYLVGGGKNIPAARRTEVEKEIARQKARVATLVFHILPDGATVRVDGNEIGKSPIALPLSVGIGEHLVSAMADGHQPTEVKVTVAGEDRRTIELTLTPIPEKKTAPELAAVPVAKETTPTLSPPLAPIAPPSVPPSAAVAPAALSPQSTVSIAADAQTNNSLAGLRVTGLVAGAGGIVGLATGMVCWWVAKSRHDDAVTYWNKGTGTNDAKAQSLQGQAQNYATAASITLISGGALTTLGLVLYLVGATDTQTSGTHARLMPAVGSGFAGITAGGIW
jgi:hypothetical protein